MTYHETGVVGIRIPAAYVDVQGLRCGRFTLARAAPVASDAELGAQLGNREAGSLLVDPERVRFAPTEGSGARHRNRSPRP